MKSNIFFFVLSIFFILNSTESFEVFIKTTNNQTTFKKGDNFTIKCSYSSSNASEKLNNLTLSNGGDVICQFNQNDSSMYCYGNNFL
jgi:hypothetical protein